MTKKFNVADYIDSKLAQGYSVPDDIDSFVKLIENKDTTKEQVDEFFDAERSVEILKKGKDTIERRERRHKAILDPELDLDNMTDEEFLDWNDKIMGRSSEGNV